jgi:hypothetical protein
MIGLKGLPLLPTAVFPYYQPKVLSLPEFSTTNYHPNRMNRQTAGGLQMEALSQISDNFRPHVANIYRTALRHTREDSNIRPIKFTIEQATKVQMRSRGIALLFP